MDEKIKVMLTTEGTYPFHQGGVSTWCDMLIDRMKEDMQFTVYAVMMNPFVTQKYTLPKDSTLIKMPLWGTEDPTEHLDLPFAIVFAARVRTTNSVIKEKFVPLMEEFIEELLAVKKDSKRFGSVITRLYDYFMKYDYVVSVKSRYAWDVYKNKVEEMASDPSNNIAKPGSYALVYSMGWLYRFFSVLCTPLPNVDIVHATASAFCCIPGIILKEKKNIPFLLTEHGVYLREQYLFLAKRGYSSYLNMFLIRMIRSVVEAGYYYADQVSPVCNYNTRWERRFGVPGDRISVIYNGVEPEKYLDTVIKEGEGLRQINVVTLARIDPIKDIKGLIEAAQLVLKKHPKTTFEVFGAVAVKEYYQECVELIKEKGMQKKFFLRGHTDDVVAAYGRGDLIALSSISEAFPYTVIEAMMAGRAIVSTDVGGVGEALEGYGRLVPPKNPKRMAEEISLLIENPKMRRELGEQAREKALSQFNVKNFYHAYYRSYVKLAIYAHEAVYGEVYGDSEILYVDVASHRESVLIYEKGLALIEFGFYDEGIAKLMELVEVHTQSPLVPLVMLDVARGYRLGNKLKKAREKEEAAKMLFALDGIGR